MKSRLLLVYNKLKDLKIVDNQKQFAGLLNYSTTYINELINGKEEISTKFIALLESKFSINPKFMKAESEEMFLVDIGKEGSELKNLLSEPQNKYGDTSDTPNSLHSKITGDQLRLNKATGTNEEELGLIYIPIAAQAGYSRNYENPLFLNQLERLYIPGLPYRGDNYRYFDVEGDSMYPTLEEGMQVVAQKIEQEHWKDTINFYIYVIVTVNQILIKRVYRKDADNFIIISDNEDMYPQELFPIANIKEMWLVKRRLDWRMTPSKIFDIKL